MASNFTHTDSSHQTCFGRQKEVFSLLDVEFDTFWEHLLWMDAFNYGGVQLLHKKSVEDEEECAVDTDTQVEAWVDTHWSISDFLPLPLQRV